MGKQVLSIGQCTRLMRVVLQGSGTGNFPYLITPDAAIQREITDRYGAYESITHNGALDQIQALATRAGQVGGVCIAFASSDSGEGFLHPGDNWGDRNK